MMNCRTLLMLILLLSPPIIGIMGEQETRAGLIKVKLTISTGNYAQLSYYGELTAGDTAVRSLIFPLMEWNRWMASPDVRRVDVINRSENVDVAIVNTTYYAVNILVTFKEPVRPRSSEKFSFTVNISRSLFVIPRGEGGNFTLLFYVISPNATLPKENLNAAVLLPQGSLIRPSEVKNPFTATQTSDGVLVEFLDPALIWPAAGGYQQFVYTINYVWVPPKTSNNTQPPPQPSPNILPLIIGAFSALIILFSALILLRRRKKEGRIEITHPKEIEARINSLDEDELKVLMKVAENRNGVKQKDLSELVGFSKAKVSRILKKLDNMGLVVREDLKRTKVIKVNELARETLMNRVKKE